MISSSRLDAGIVLNDVRKTLKSDRRKSIIARTPPRNAERLQFLARLNELFSRRLGENHGSIYLVQKRRACGSIQHTSTIYSRLAVSFGRATSDDPPMADLKPASPLPILIRATNGKSKRSKSDKIKLSTVVQPEDLEGFFVRYADCCKAGMQGLRKRDRKAKKKDKGKKKKAVA